jgi:nitric oxide synthase oxygenase domain/subunit
MLALAWLQAVIYSYRQACVGMVDHHTLMQGFWQWYNVRESVHPKLLAARLCCVCA